MATAIFTLTARSSEFLHTERVKIRAELFHLSVINPPVELQDLHL
jgi:hypothetical protein